MKKLYLVFLALSVCCVSFPQIREITRLPVQNPSKSIKESSLFLFLNQNIYLYDFRKADSYEVTFNSSGLASGVYIYQIKVNDFITSKKMVILR
jgi:hypothetical protein